MIVRITGHGRWHLDDRLAPQLRSDQQRLQRAIDQHNEAEYRAILAALSNYVQTHGHALSNILGNAASTLPSPLLTLTESSLQLARDGNGGEAASS